MTKNKLKMGLKFHPAHQILNGFPERENYTSFLFCFFFFFMAVPQKTASKVTWNRAGLLVGLGCEALASPDSNLTTSTVSSR